MKKSSGKEVIVRKLAIQFESNPFLFAGAHALETVGGGAGGESGVRRVGVGEGHG